MQHNPPQSAAMQSEELKEMFLYSSACYCLCEQAQFHFASGSIGMLGRKLGGGGQASMLPSVLEPLPFKTALAFS